MLPFRALFFLLRGLVTMGFSIPFSIFQIVLVVEKLILSRAPIILVVFHFAKQGVDGFNLFNG